MKFIEKKHQKRELFFMTVLQYIYLKVEKLTLQQKNINVVRSRTEMWLVVVGCVCGCV
jgi:hypothetical protein